MVDKLYSIKSDEERGFIKKNNANSSGMYSSMFLAMDPAIVDATEKFTPLYGLLNKNYKYKKPKRSLLWRINAWIMRYFG